MVAMILKRYFAPGITVIATLCAYHYLTRDIGCGASAEGRLLLNAMAAYQHQHGRYPPTFSDLQPILRNNTTPATTVKHVYENTYEVNVVLSAD